MGRYGIGERLAVEDRCAIDEDGYMRADLTLVIQKVTPKRRCLPIGRLQDLLDGGAWQVEFGTRELGPEVGGEAKESHRNNLSYGGGGVPEEPEPGEEGEEISGRGEGLFKRGALHCVGRENGHALPDHEAYF